ncbi:unnamed protein product [Lepeophtheirus salmonis]|uniref:(salmon louse) hypothetical protein n=1 Tax=Lepeophtheirus salmonis TaxID=72036 RepID=A0A7R8CZV2_LEPSM|nr:unnamed protein product [Lepeophtheirus salmonis]CAF2977865.1 unnamed protein product [Lepeophtheirus salmonis]
MFCMISIDWTTIIKKKTDQKCLIYLSDPIYRSDPDLLDLDELSKYEGWEDSSIDLTSYSIRPPILKNAFQIHKKRTLSPGNGEEIWQRMEGEVEVNKNSDEIDFHASTLPYNKHNHFREPPKAYQFMNENNGASYSKKMHHNPTISFQKLALEEPSEYFVTKSLPSIPKSAHILQNSVSTKPKYESLISKVYNNHTSNHLEPAQSVPDFWNLQSHQSEEKTKRKKKRLPEGLYHGSDHSGCDPMRTKKEGLILDHWGKKAPSKEEMRKLIEENSEANPFKPFDALPPTQENESSTMKSSTPKIIRRDNRVVYIDS